MPTNPILVPSSSLRLKWQWPQEGRGQGGWLFQGLSPFTLSLLIDTWSCSQAIDKGGPETHAAGLWPYDRSAHALPGLWWGVGIIWEQEVLFWLYLLSTTAESPYSVSDNELALPSRNSKSRREKKEATCSWHSWKYYNDGVPVSICYSCGCWEGPVGTREITVNGWGEEG